MARKRVLTPPSNWPSCSTSTATTSRVASLLHSKDAMAAISCAPTVRATAAPKVAVRRTNVRAAASGLRTQFGAVKGFAPVG